jgi:hypothetical protein
MEEGWDSITGGEQRNSPRLRPGATNVEESTSEREDLHSNLTAIVDPCAGKPLPGEAEMLWDMLSRNEDEGQPYTPFCNKQEWELCYWLSTEGLSEGTINRFLKLQWVREHVFYKLLAQNFGFRSTNILTLQAGAMLQRCMSRSKKCQDLHLGRQK